MDKSDLIALCARLRRTTRQLDVLTVIDELERRLVVGPTPATPVGPTLVVGPTCPLCERRRQAKATSQRRRRAKLRGT
jgi:hypothetical protein